MKLFVVDYFRVRTGLLRVRIRSSSMPYPARRLVSFAGVRGIEMSLV